MENGGYDGGWVNIFDFPKWRRCGRRGSNTIPLII